MADLNLNLKPWQRVVFILHLAITFLAWFAPFLVSWFIIVPVYLLIFLQFVFFGRCLLNKSHNIDSKHGDTIYSYIFDYLHIAVDKEKLSYFIHKPLYLLLSLVTLVWQVGLGFKPLLF